MKYKFFFEPPRCRDEEVRRYDGVVEFGKRSGAVLCGIRHARGVEIKFEEANSTPLSAKEDRLQLESFDYIGMKPGVAALYKPSNLGLMDNI